MLHFLLKLVPAGWTRLNARSSLSRASAFVLPVLQPSSFHFLPAPSLHSVCDLAARGRVLAETQRVQRLMDDENGRIRRTEPRKARAHADQGTSGRREKESGSVMASRRAAAIGKDEALEQFSRTDSENGAALATCRSGPQPVPLGPYFFSGAGGASLL